MTYEYCQEHILPHYLAWGVDEAAFWDGCPTDLKAYGEAHKIKMQEQEYLFYIAGRYNADALLCTVGNMFKKKGSTPIEYPDKPYGFFENSNHKELSEHEKMLEVEKFYAAEAARRANWKRIHNKNEDSTGS